MPKSYGLRDYDLIKYKIHGVPSVAGESHSANNNVFYDTLDEAIDKCCSYMSKTNAPARGFVIMKTCAVIKPVEAPVKVFHLGADDEFFEED